MSVCEAKIEAKFVSSTRPYVVCCRLVPCTRSWYWFCFQRWFSTLPSKFISPYTTLREGISSFLSIIFNIDACILPIRNIFNTKLFYSFLTIKIWILIAANLFTFEKLLKIWKKTGDILRMLQISELSLLSKMSKSTILFKIILRAPKYLLSQRSHF